MNVIDTKIPEVKIFEPQVFGDSRGFFFESFNQKVFEDAIGSKRDFVQDNHSKSQKGVLRGLHYQLPPMVFLAQPVITIMLEKHSNLWIGCGRL
jgi:dTDP-4-dehydrorhamnose 3,5-epimerase